MGVIAPGSGQAPHQHQINCTTPNLIFCGDLKHHAHFQTPKITPSERKVSEAEEGEEEKKTNLNKLGLSWARLSSN
jgi:hypothetical protein